MSGAEDVGGYGGPSDDGTGMAVWLAFQQLDDAREEYTAAVRDEGVSEVVKALLAPLGGARGGGV